MRVPDHWLPKNQQPTTAAGRVADLSFGQLTAMLASHFLPASVMSPPSALGGSGNRRTVLTSADAVVNSINGQSGDVSVRPTDTKLAALVGGAYTWTFATVFAKEPCVFAFAIGSPPTTGSPPVPTVLYAGAVSSTAATINSYLATDTRMVMLLAIGNPD